MSFHNKIYHSFYLTIIWSIPSFFFCKNISICRPAGNYFPSLKYEPPWKFWRVLLISILHLLYWKFSAQLVAYKNESTHIIFPIYFYSLLDEGAYTLHLIVTALCSVIEATTILLSYLCGWVIPHHPPNGNFYNGLC